MSVRSPILALEHQVSLVDELLEAQSRLGPAVNQFAQWQQERADEAPPRGFYRDLLPLERPGRGEQYAFEVALDRCTGCKACVTACHSLNGLDDDESWREVGLVVGGRERGHAQTITTACHHCTDPACANGCPVLAYEKDSETGIVRHLDDQCIGCSYCILKCPYDVPKFNARRGIVRKCDMCHGRLEAGEAPACVQACPTAAIAIRIVEIGPKRAGECMVPGAFDSGYTGPTTRYTSVSGGADLARPADAHRLRLDPAHWPLAVMLVLVQMAAGGLCLATASVWIPGTMPEHAVAWLYAMSALLALTGIALSLLHLGQPLKAWRVFLGWRKSWLSREAIVFGAFVGAAGATAIAWLLEGDGPLPRGLGALAAALGLLGVVVSAMVYIDTRRPFWSGRLVWTKFAATVLLLGAGLAAVVWSWAGVPVATAPVLTAWIGGFLLAAGEMSAVRRAAEDPECSWHKSALTMLRVQRPLLDGRRILLVLAGALVPVALLGSTMLAAPVLTGAFGCAVASQLLERHQFFTACAGPRMPGSP